jgi:dihydrofolate reductase
MGRKTWDSIPPRFRPLKDRTNIVISRGLKPDSSPSNGVIVSSIDSAIDSAASEGVGVDRKIFVIGGAQIYEEALKKEQANRILLTRVLTDFECDTFFPIQLNEDGEGEDGWERKSKEELDRWTGETVPEGVQEEGGTKYVFEMWERK